MRVSSRGGAVIEALDGPVGREDGRPHLVRLTREARGDMAVAVDGTALMRVRDRSFRDPFDGVVLRATAGASPSARPPSTERSSGRRRGAARAGAA